MRPVWLFCLALACGGDGSRDQRPSTGGGEADAGEAVADASAADASSADASSADAGAADAAILIDAAIFDASTHDAAPNECPDELCSDGLACNGVEVCDDDDGTCSPGEPLDCGESDLCFTRGCVEAGGGTCTEEMPRHPISLFVTSGQQFDSTLYTLQCGEPGPQSSGPCSFGEIRYRCRMNAAGEIRVVSESTVEGCRTGQGPFVPYEPGQCSVFQPDPGTDARCCFGYGG